MVTTTQLEPVANTYLLLTNILNAVRIDKLTVPDVVASDCLDAVLDCAYSGAGDDVTLLWLYNGTQVYEWKPGAEPQAAGMLDGRLDVTYRLTSADGQGTERRALRIVELSPELSGDYTCVVRSRGHEVRGTKHMTVFSPERDFELTFNSSRDYDVINVKCAAKHMHPRPDLIIEYNNIPVAQQQQRSWREGPYFDAESTATLLPHTEAMFPPKPPSPPAPAELACRLRLPRLDYTAITKKYLYLGNQASGSRLQISLSSFLITLIYIHTIL